MRIRLFAHANPDPVPKMMRIRISKTVSILENAVLLIKGHGSGSIYLKMNNVKKSKKWRKNAIPTKMVNEVGFNNVSLVWFPY
jgi:hypothetical protein